MEWSQDDEDTPTFATFLERGAVYTQKLHLMSLCTNGGLNPQYVPITVVYVLL